MRGEKETGENGTGDTRPDYERSLFLWLSVVPLVVFVCVFFTLLGAPYSTGLFLKIIVPVYAVSISPIVSASLRFAQYLGYERQRAALIALAGLPTLGFFPSYSFCARPGRENEADLHA